MAKGNPHRIRATRGRPRDIMRDIALASGAKHYTGQPCKLGHCGKRYTSTGACVACVSAYRLSGAEGPFSGLFD